MNCCPIVSTQEVEIDIILGALTVWTTFHVEQNLLNLFFSRPQLFLATIWMKISNQLKIDQALKTVLLGRNPPKINITFSVPGPLTL